ncbi:hypothetical protein RQP46_010819 [Phenoliferia psychrophenolica]
MIQLLEEDKREGSLPDGLIAYALTTRKSVDSISRSTGNPSRTVENPKSFPVRFGRSLQPSAILTKRYVCNQCGWSCQGTDSALLDQLPAHCTAALRPYTLTYRSAIDQLSTYVFGFGFAKGLGPEATANLSRELAAKEKTREALDQAVSLLEGTVLHGDGSLKHDLHGLLAICYTMLNEYGEIRLQPSSSPSGSLSLFLEPMNGSCEH